MEPPKSAYDFASLTITLGAGNPDLISTIQVLQVDENGAGATPVGFGSGRPGQSVTMKVDVPVVVGQKVCLQVAQDDGAEHLSMPSPTVCGTAVGKDSAPSASSCSFTPGSSSGLASLGFLALAALACRRRRSVLVVPSYVE